MNTTIKNKTLKEALQAEKIPEYTFNRFKIKNPHTYDKFLGQAEIGGYSVALKVYFYQISTSGRYN